jgi:hypothetical protein
VATAHDGESAIAVLDEREANELRTRRMLAFGVALLCFLILIGIAVYNTYRAKKIREEAQKQRDLAVQKGSFNMQGAAGDGAGSGWMGEPAPSGDAGSGSLADITIPPPPK